MPDNTRIEELRRRVQSDPASIAFAALAEEYRRAGHHEEAIATCKAGLRRHPAYLSAHVTLGRALIEVGQYDEAREELEHVLKIAPENLAAIRGLAEIHHRLGETEASELAGAVAATVDPASAIPLKRTAQVPVNEPAPWEMPLAALERLTAATSDGRPAIAVSVVTAPAPVVDPALPRLEEFLSAILRARSDLERGALSSRP